MADLIRERAPVLLGHLMFGPWLSVPREAQRLCAVEGCEVEGRPHECFYDGAHHHHGCIHYECAAAEVTGHGLVFRKDGWGLLCDAHYAVLRDAYRRSQNRAATRRVFALLNPPEQASMNRIRPALDVLRDEFDVFAVVARLPNGRTAFLRSGGPGDRAAAFLEDAQRVLEQENAALERASVLDGPVALVHRVTDGRAALLVTETDDVYLVAAIGDAPGAAHVSRAPFLTMAHDSERLDALAWSLIDECDERGTWETPTSPMLGWLREQGWIDHNGDVIG